MATDLATALANDGRKLAKYQGKDVLRTSIAIKNAGDGLSEALAIEPTELKIGSTQFVVMECVVSGHKHEDMPKVKNAMQLVQTLKAGTATLVDESLVRELLDEQAEKIETAREKAAGVTKLPGTEAAAKKRSTSKKAAAKK